VPKPPKVTLDTLRAWREDRAARLGASIASVLSNQCLEELARRRPGSPEALFDVPGIGPAKMAQFGQELLAIFDGVASVVPPPEGGDPTEHLPEDMLDPRHAVPGLSPEPGLSPAPGSSPVQGLSSVPGLSPPSYYWTWRLLAAGFSPGECVAIRGLESEEVVLDHALRAAEAGYEVRPEWCLDGQLIAAIEQLIGNESPRQIRPLLARLPEGTRYEQVQLYVTWLAGQRPPSRPGL
jgi:hypothetical protein